MANKKLKPILGVLVKVVDFGYLPMFIKDEFGFERLSFLISRSYMRGDQAIHLSEITEKIPTISSDDLGIICLTGTNEDNNNIFFTNDRNNILNKLNLLHEIFQDDLYIEITSEKQQLLLDLALELDISVVVTKPIRFLHKEQLEPFFVFHAIDTGAKFIQEEVDNFIFKEDYVNNKKIWDDFDWLKEGLENTKSIANKCNFALIAQKQKVPKYIISSADHNFIHNLQEQQLYTTYESLSQIIQLQIGTFLPEELELDYLKINSLEGLKIKLHHIPQETHHIYYERLDMELSVLENKKFCAYFLVTADFIKYARDKNILIGPGRGSGTGSLIAYVLQITSIDPIEFGLIFERFLNPGRDAVPDFDIDFEPERRNEVVEYLINKYGAFNVVHVATFGSLLARRAILDVCKVLSIKFSDSITISKLVPHDQVNPINLTQAIELVPKLKELSVDSK